jgi:hypothetical protein
MGAQWIHGQISNPIFEYAVENNLILDGYESIELLNEEICPLTNTLKGFHY